MSLRVWYLTLLGQAMAKSTSNPRSDSWRIIHYLDLSGAKTTEQISQYTGLGLAEVSSVMRRLSSGNKPIVTEISQVEVS